MNYTLTPVELTPAERRLLSEFRRMDDEARGMLLELVPEYAKEWPRRANTHLRLVASSAIKSAPND